MSWGRVDDTMPEHRKWAALEEQFGARTWADAMAVWLCVLCHANRNETDGEIPTSQLVRLTPLGKGATKAADAMVAVGLMRRTESGYAIHDFTDYNPSKRDREEKRKADAERQKRHRGRASDGTFMSQRDNADCHTVTNSVSHGVSHTSPVPARPDPSHDHDRVSGSEPVARGLSLARPESAHARSLAAFGDEIRSGLVEAIEAEKLPAHPRTRDLTWDGWARIARWARQMAGMRGRDERDVAAQLVRAFMASKRAADRGYPPQFLAENPAEFWRDAA